MLTKNVNGVDVPMSAEEEAQILAEWAENDKRKIVESAVQSPTVEDLQSQIYVLQSTLEAKGIISAPVA